MPLRKVVVEFNLRTEPSLQPRGMSEVSDHSAVHPCMKYPYHHPEKGRPTPAHLVFYLFCSDACPHGGALWTLPSSAAF